MNKTLIFPTLFLLLTSFTSAYSVSEVIKGTLLCSDYFAGFIKDENNLGLKGVTIVVTDNKNKLWTLKSEQIGWFESHTPLSISTNLDTVNLIFMKRGYGPVQKKLILKGRTDERCKIAKKYENILRIKLTSIPDYYIDDEEDYFPLNVLHGFAYNKDDGNPISGARLTLSSEKYLTIGSAVTKKSGFFSLYYERENDISELNYTLNHNAHSKVTGTLENQEYLEISMPKVLRNFSIGLGMHLQSTFDTSNKESGGALSLNAAWYPGGLLMIDPDLNQYKSKKEFGFIGVEFSLGFIPFLVEKPGRDEIKNIYVYGLGLVYDSVDFYSYPIQFRTGISISDTEKVAFYLGFNVPFFFF